MKARLLLLLLSFAPLLLSGQKLSLVDSVSLKGVEAVSIDRQGSYYIADQKGSLKKFNKKNEVIAEFSPQKTGSISLIEAWNPLRPFIFYENFQEYVFLDRFLTASNRFSVSPITDYAGLITVSADNNLWVVDLADFGLKKYNISFGQFTIETSFDLLLNPDKYEITHMREYQSRVFVSDSKSGILVFDNLGNYLHKIAASAINYFGIAGDEIYYLENSSVVFSNIYTKETRRFELKERPKFVLSDGNTLKVFYKNLLKVYLIEK